MTVGESADFPANLTPPPSGSGDFLQSQISFTLCEDRILCNIVSLLPCLTIRDSVSKYDIIIVMFCQKIKEESEKENNNDRVIESSQIEVFHEEFRP